MSKQTNAGILWHPYPEELPTKDGFYRVEGLFGLSTKKKLMVLTSWYTARKKSFAVSVGVPDLYIAQWAAIEKDAE